MKRNRESAKGLLPLMEARRWADGKTITYRYHPIGGKPMSLGTDRLAAIRKVLDMLGNNKDQGTLRWISCRLHPTIATTVNQFLMGLRQPAVKRFRTFACIIDTAPHAITPSSLVLWAKPTGNSAEGLK